MAAFCGIAAHSVYDMFSWYKYISVILFFATPRFWSGNFFLTAPFPVHCLLVLSSSKNCRFEVAKDGRMCFVKA